jgi:hypothetical protein
MFLAEDPMSEMLAEAGWDTRMPSAQRERCLVTIWSKGKVFCHDESPYWRARAICADVLFAQTSTACEHFLDPHHLSDVVVGTINGLACAALAAACLVHRRSNAGEASQLAGAAERVPRARP